MAQQQHAVYTAEITAQAVTLTPKVSSVSQPSHLGASTIVFNTAANPAPTEFWAATDEYIVTVQRRTATG